MERALHPHLAKRFLEPVPGGSIRLTDTSALELVMQVRVDAHGWVDYMHLARFRDRWLIVNVLWEIRDQS